MNQNWDVTKYRSPHEPQYQWELKKKFMDQVSSSASGYFVFNVFISFQNANIIHYFTNKIILTNMF
jgi:hypothetical protein